MNSKPKLALAMLTSPTAAFEEILRRRLLGSAIALVVITGALATVPALVYGLGREPVKLFLLGKQNPLCWLGLFMLYAFLLQKLLKWVGTEVDYLSMLTLMGWAQVSLLLAQLAVAIGSVIDVYGGDAGSTSILGTASLAMHVWYVALVGMGIRSVTGSPLSRGILSYMVIEIAAMIAFSFTYGNARFGAFANALPGIKSTAGIVIAADQMPWLAAGVVGLLVGIWQLGKHVQWEPGQAARLAVTAAVVGVAVFGLYAYAMSDANYYGRLTDAQRHYNRDEFAAAARTLEGLRPISPGNADLAVQLGDLYFLAGSGEAALRNYEQALKDLKKGQRPDAAMWRARVHNGIGTVHDFDGNHKAALRGFETATKDWPEFREPWVRKAVTYNRLGDYKKAIESANHAIKELESDAVVAWVALAEAYASTNDLKQAKAAMEMVTGEDEDLAKKIGSKPEDWKNAVDKLTRDDLKFPLEAEMAPRPKKK